MWCSTVRCIMTLILSLLVTPLCTNAQQPGKVYRIGFLFQGSPPLPSAATPNLDAFKHRLRELGWVEGQNLALEYRWAEGQFDQLVALAADLVGRQVDVIVADVTLAASRGETEAKASLTPAPLEPLPDPALTLPPSQPVAPPHPALPPVVRLCASCRHANASI